LKWGASTGVGIHYWYCYATSNPCTAWTDNGTATSKALTGLAFNTTYYWHVKAVNNMGTTYANAVTTDWSFKTGNVPGAFNKTAPANNLTNQPYDLTLSWSASPGVSITYWYCYATTNPCSSWINNGTSTSVSLSGLHRNRSYYWNVKAVNSFGTTYANASASNWTFKTAVPVPVLNGGFESGDAPWLTYSLLGYPIIYNNILYHTAHGGSWLAWLGGVNGEFAYVEQDNINMDGVRYLHFWYWIDSEDDCGFDGASVQVNDGVHGWAVVKVYDLCKNTKTTGWVPGTIDLSSYTGGTISLAFVLTTDVTNASSFYLDDVSITP
jgi:hypothetical protein